MFCRSFFAVGCLAGLCVVLAGCGGGAGDEPETVGVTGSVSYQGRPVPKISVAFTPTNGKVAMGETDEEGKFSLTTNDPGDGAIVGEHTVTLVPVPDEVPDMFAPPKRTKPGEAPIPPKYGAPKKSGLTATVTSDSAKNVFDFNLE